MTHLLASPWIPAAALLMLACGARLISQSWFAPSVFASALWAVFVATALCIAPDYPVSSLSIWLITVLILAVQVGALCGEGAPAKKANLAWVQPRRQIRLLPFVLTFSLLASFGPIYLAIETIREHDLANSIVRFLAVGHLLSVARYSGEQEPILYRAVLTWLYPAAALAGIDFALARVRGRKVASLVVFVPALLVGLFQSEKAPTLIAICLWLGTYLATKGYSKDVKYRLSKKKLAIGIVTFVSAAVCFYVVLDAIKTNEKKDDFVVEADWARVKSSFVGSLSVFSQWADKADTGPMTYGAYTFAGVFDIFGARPRQQGIYDVSITLPDGVESNIYTAFRGLIQDFSLPGALVACVVAGWLAGSSYRNSTSGRFEKSPILAAYYAFFCFSPIISLFTYNGPILALVVCALACRAMGKSAAPSSKRIVRPNPSDVVQGLTGGCL